MRVLIPIPPVYADGELGPEALGGYPIRGRELRFLPAWAQEQTLGSWPQLSPLEAMTFAAACTDRLRLGCERPHRRERQPPPGHRETQFVQRHITAVPALKLSCSVKLPGGSSRSAQRGTSGA